MPFSPDPFFASRFSPHNWTLDALGNWGEFRQDTDGDGNWNLDQDRTHDEVNEITDITGGSWVDPVHDAAGNMTTIPRPASPTTGYTATYDAWNRLVKLQSGQTTEAEYGYDGMNQRIVKKKYTRGYLVETRHFYYNDRWQCVEERLQPSYTIAANPICRYVWGARYIDELILRQRDTDANGTLDETLYAMQDANFNVVAMATSDDNPINPSFDVVERFVYDAYGKATPLDPDFTSYSGSDYQWDYLYTGRRLDRESGLMYYRNRYYHTGMGRFVTRDPIGYAGSKWNLYEYVEGSPVTLTDASGLGVMVTMNCVLVDESKTGTFSKACRYNCIEDTTVPRQTCAKGGTDDFELPKPITYSFTDTILRCRSCPKTQRMEDYCFSSYTPPGKDCSK